MKQNAKHILYLLLILLIVTLPIKAFDFRDGDLQASVSQAKTVDGIIQKRKNFEANIQDRNVPRLVNVLIVPGHDDDIWGTQFNGLKEVELNRMLALKIRDYLALEEGINPVLASDENGYHPIFETYFESERENIGKFIADSKEKFSEKLTSEHGSESDLDSDYHNVAADETIHRLYGINRWVSVQDFDLVIHVHFNDYRGRKKNREGKYEGFSIYAPSRLLENYELSRNLADSVFGELKKVRPISNLESESAGIIEGHELIAVGANETLKAGSILVEYGYIYEPIFTDQSRRTVTLDYLGYATYAGVMKTLQEVPKPKVTEETKITKGKTTADNLKWQFQKALEGLYPPAGKNLKDCPIAGFFGKCSQSVK